MSSKIVSKKRSAEDCPAGAEECPASAGARKPKRLRLTFSKPLSSSLSSSTATSSSSSNKSKKEVRTQTQTRPTKTLEKPTGAGVRKPKRLRLTFSKRSPSSSSLPTAPSSPPSSGSKKEVRPQTKTRATKTIEKPTGELVEVIEDFNWDSVTRDPTTHWPQSTMTLDFPRLVQHSAAELTYTWVYEQDVNNPIVFRPTCWPNAPADTIHKTLFLHPRHRGLVWGGAGSWAAAKLRAEVARYERVKWFWLFNDGAGYLANWDSKYLYAARRFRRELESPWVATWLRELIGEEEVAKILACMETE